MAERRPYEFLAGGESSGEAIDVHGEDDVDLDVELEREDSRLRPEKKRRLRAEQVQSLERSFEVENKLEPERKLQLAMELGLQPRQVAIWFQNRRARWKTKQLEKDYQALQACYDALVAKYEALAAEKEKLRSEVVALTEKLRLKEKGEPPVAVAAAAELEDKLFVGKQEEVSAANSAVLDGDGDMAALELTSSFTALEQDADDLSPAVEDDAEEPPRLTSFGLAGDHAFWLWPTD